MSFLSHRVDRSKIKAGDHVYTWRAAFTYSHHGIYVGNNMVVHFTAPEDVGSGSGSGSGSSTGSASWNVFSGFQSSYPNYSTSCLCSVICGFQEEGSGVTLSCLNCFVGSGSLYLYQYEVSKLKFIAEVRGGTCTTAKSDPPQEVIHRVRYLLQHGFGSYDVFRNNCEDFALYCKTGLLIRGKPTTGSSGQVHFLVNEPWKAIVSSILSKIVGGPVSVAASIGVHGLNRYKTDIGVREDVVKVRVEEVALFRENCTSDNH